MNEEFNYVVGFYWPGTDTIAEYSYGGSVNYGTMKQAKAWLKEVQSKDTEEKYKIFKLVKV